MVRTGKTLLTMLAIFTVQNAEASSNDLQGGITNQFGNSHQNLMPNNFLYENNAIRFSANSAFQRNEPLNNNGNPGVHDLINPTGKNPKFIVNTTAKNIQDGNILLPDNSVPQKNFPLDNNKDAHDLISPTEENPKFVVHTQQLGRNQYKNIWYFEGNENPQKNSKKVSNRIGRFKSKRIKINENGFTLEQKFFEEICNNIQDSNITVENVELPSDGLYCKNTKLFKRNTRKLARPGLIEYLYEINTKISNRGDVTLSQKEIFQLFNSVLYTGEYPSVRGVNDTKGSERYLLRKERDNLKIRKSDGSVDLRLIGDTVASFAQFNGHFPELIISASAFVEDQTLRSNAKSVLNMLTEIAKLAILYREISQKTTFARETTRWCNKKYNNRIRGIKQTGLNEQNAYLTYKIEWNAEIENIRICLKKLLENAIDESCDTFVNKFRDVLTKFSTELRNKNMNNKNYETELSKDESKFLASLKNIKQAFQNAGDKENLQKISLAITLPANETNPNTIKITSLAELFEKKLKPLIEASMDQIASSYKKEVISEKQTENTKRSK